MTVTIGPSLAQQGAPPQAPTMAEPTPVGTWIDHTGRGAIEIQPCGTELCGRIVWLQSPNDKRGQPLRDALNPQAGLRARPICGLPVIGNLKRQRDGSWDNGWIYDPEKGEQYDVELRLRGPDTLQVKGYLGVKFLSETFTWRRSTAPIQTACAAG
jgi:uncharacterized protein (DUF2147 family)